MKQVPYLLATPVAREVVRHAIMKVCAFRSWWLYGLHVRTNHVHGVVGADVPPSRILNDWKAYATRALRRGGGTPLGGMAWTRGGSTHRIWTPEHLTAALRYVLKNQGDPLETYCSDPRLLSPP
jgi:REP element-mobilizing transposase RayT